MKVLVTSRNEEDLIKIEGATVAKTLNTKGGPVNCGLCLLYKNYSMHRLPTNKNITYICSGHAYKISEKYT